MMPWRTESVGEDCGIEGEDAENITVRQHNRFVMRVLRGHIQPMHLKLEHLDTWNKEADDTIAQIKGGIYVIKNLIWILLGTVGVTAVGMFALLEHLLALLKG